MNQELYDLISHGKPDFLRQHYRFEEELTEAVETLEKMAFN